MTSNMGLLLNNMAVRILIDFSPIKHILHWRQTLRGINKTPNPAELAGVYSAFAPDSLTTFAHLTV
jgi:hypothetical protein